MLCVHSQEEKNKKQNKENKKQILMIKPKPKIFKRKHENKMLG
jgi:hypothetical protein